MEVCRKNSQELSIKNCIPKTKIVHPFVSSSSIWEILSDYSRDENAPLFKFDSCSQKAPYFRADDMASSKIKYDIDSLNDEVDKLSSLEGCGIFHTFNFKVKLSIHS